MSDTLSLQYTFDDNGNISGIDEDGLKQSFFYEHGRLALADMSSGEYAYGYDDVGNRIASYENKKGAEPTEKEYAYSEGGSGNRLLSAKDVVSGVEQEYTYNEVGAALKAGDEYSYVYNVNQRPIEVYKSGELIAEYRYNTFGERVQKTSYTDGVAESTFYLYDGHTLAAEIDNNGQVTSQYLYLQDLYPVVKFEGNDVYAIHTDQLGTPRKLTDDNADLVWDASYTPFGQADVTLAKVEMNLRFPGQYEDRETSTHYNYYRDYDPGTGRYITNDPIGLQGGLNAYAYVDGDPQNKRDVLGLAPDNSQLVIDGVQKPVVDHDYMDKLKFVLLEAGKQAGDDLQQIVLEMVKPENLLATAVVAGALTAVQGVPIVGALVNAGLLAYTYWNFGQAGIDFIKALVNTGFALVTANTLSSLCSAAISLGSSLASVGEHALGIINRGKRSNNSNITANDINNPRGNGRPVVTDRVDLPTQPRYTRDGENVKGPGGANYTKTEYSHESHAVFEYEHGGYYIFRNGKKEKVDSPRPPANRVVTGAVGERQASQAMKDNVYDPIGSQTVKPDADLDTALGRQGQTGIDGIYKNAEGKYVILEAKASETGTAGGLTKPNSGRQMSEDWINQNLTPDKTGLDADEIAKIKAGIRTGDTKLIKAEITGVNPGGSGQPPSNGTIKMYEINQAGSDEATKGGLWVP